MNNLVSLLSFVDFGSALVNVLAIIAIIIAGGFIIFFLGDLLLSILDPKTEDKKKEKESRPEVLKEETKVEEHKFVPVQEVKPEPVKEEKEEEVKTVDEDLAEKERLELGFQEEPKADNYDELRKAEEEYKQNNLKAIEERQNIVKEESADDDIDLNDFFFDDEDFNFGVQEDETQNEEKPEEKSEEQLDGQVSIFNEEQTNNEEKVENEATEEQSEKVDEEALAEIEELRKELEQQRAEYEALKEQTEQEKNKWKEERAALENLFEATETKEEFVPMMTLKEYEARLEVLKERLKANEKDLKANKKEFLPLMRVKKNLDNDKKKLRRKEALVAKQKVVLYGVNNYVDIDEEKAKKLAEDLDLLDGLRLSVQHCEEVIAANKERYPILETTNRILTTVNKEIKADIAEVETAIAKLKAEEDAGAKEEVVEETQPQEEVANAEEKVEEVASNEQKQEETNEVPQNNTEN